MLSSKIDSYNSLIKGVLAVISGFIFCFSDKELFLKVFALFGYGLIIFNIISLIAFLFKKGERKLYDFLVRFILDMLLAMFFISEGKLFMTSISLDSGIYLLFHSAISLANCILYIRYNIKGKLANLMQFIINLIFAILLIVNPFKNIIYVQIVMGIYIIIYGLSRIFDFISDIIPKKTSNKIKKRIKITLPIFMNFFLPGKLLNIINEELKVQDMQNNLNINKSKDMKPDIEVLIHLAPNGTAKLGHVEIAFKGLVYSFGNYDLHSRKFFQAFGDGVLLIAPKEEYVKYAVTKRDRYIVSFGLKLTDKQIANVTKKIDNLVNKNTIDYHSDYELAELGILPSKEYNDMSSEIYRYAGGKFKKFTAGKNKKFFVLKTNCVVIAESILETTDQKMLDINGLITPGTYYEYLNEEFLKKNSNVITRKVYTKYDYVDFESEK